MAEANPQVPQAVDPEVTADLTRLLRIRGPLGILNVLDTIIPVVSLGNVVTPDINIRGPIFRSTDVFSEGRKLAPVGGTILADTLALPAGTYDVKIMATALDIASIVSRLQHRNAANNANLMTLDIQLGGGGGDNMNGMLPMSFSYELALNERLRIDVGENSSVGSVWTAAIFARIR